MSAERRPAGKTKWAKRGRLLTALLCLYGSQLLAQKSAPAAQTFEDVKAQAQQQHKLIFLVFSASWCGACHRLDAFLAEPEPRQILDKYFVETKVHVLEQRGKYPESKNPDGEDLAVKFGVANAKGQVGSVPIIVLLDATGQPIVNSYGPRGFNIGYPAKPEEINWFIAMLKKAAPAITSDELRTIDHSFRQASSK